MMKQLQMIVRRMWLMQFIAHWIAFLSAIFFVRLISSRRLCVICWHTSISRMNGQAKLILYFVSSHFSIFILPRINSIRDDSEIIEYASEITRRQFIFACFYAFFFCFFYFHLFCRLFCVITCLSINLVNNKLSFANNNGKQLVVETRNQNRKQIRFRLFFFFSRSSLHRYTKLRCLSCGDISKSITQEKILIASNGKIITFRFALSSSNHRFDSFTFCFKSHTNVMFIHESNAHTALSDSRASFYSFHVQTHTNTQRLSHRRSFYGRSFQ